MKTTGTGKEEQPRITSSYTIRAFTPGDIEAVVEMSRIHFPQCSLVSPGYLYETIDELYFKDTLKVDGINSLVSVDENDVVNGFLGVTPKPFLFKGEKVLGALCNHLMASEDARAALIPMRLLQEFLSGPQEFSYADGSVESTRLLWKRLGGEPSYSNSVYYKVPLRPMSFGTRPFQSHLPTSLRGPLRTLSYGADYLFGVVRMPMSHRNHPDLTLNPIDTEEILTVLARVWKSFNLTPEITISEFSKLFHMLDKDPRNGKLHKIGIWNKRDVLIGWFVYYASKGGVCEVMQAVSLPGKEVELFESITWHAFSEGGTELSGRALPSQIGTPFTSKSFSMPGRMWTLFHSKNEAICRSMQSDKAFITRLEGDLWLI